MGNRNWATADGNEPENAGRRETGGRRTKGENPAGKRETGGKPAGETGGREVRPQTTRVRARGSGAARIYDAAGRVPAGQRELRIVIHQLPGGRGRLSVARPARCTPREHRPAPAAAC